MLLFTLALLCVPLIVNLDISLVSLEAGLASFDVGFRAYFF